MKIYFWAIILFFTCCKADVKTCEISEIIIDSFKEHWIAEANVLRTGRARYVEFDSSKLDTFHDVEFLIRNNIKSQNVDSFWHSYLPEQTKLEKLPFDDLSCFKNELLVSLAQTHPMEEFAFIDSLSKRTIGKAFKGLLNIYEPFKILSGSRSKYLFPFSIQLENEKFILVFLDENFEIEETKYL